MESDEWDWERKCLDAMHGAFIDISGPFCITVAIAATIRLKQAPPFFEIAFMEPLIVMQFLGLLSTSIAAVAILLDKRQQQQKKMQPQEAVQMEDKEALPEKGGSLNVEVLQVEQEEQEVETLPEEEGGSLNVEVLQVEQEEQEVETLPEEKGGSLNVEVLQVEQEEQEVETLPEEGGGEGALGRGETMGIKEAPWWWRRLKESLSGRLPWAQEDTTRALRLRVSISGRLTWAQRWAQEDTSGLRQKRRRLLAIALYLVVDLCFFLGLIRHLRISETSWTIIQQLTAACRQYGLIQSGFNYVGNHKLYAIKIAGPTVAVVGVMLFLVGLCAPVSPLEKTQKETLKTMAQKCLWPMLVAMSLASAIGSLYYMVQLEHKRSVMRAVTGNSFVDDEWGFGQVVAIFLWAPVLFQSLLVGVISVVTVGILLLYIVGWRPD